MKHLTIIQSQFLKEARKWDDLSHEEQVAYLKRHKKSKRKLTKSKSDTKVRKYKIGDKIYLKDKDIFVVTNDDYFGHLYVRDKEGLKFFVKPNDLENDVIKVVRK
jgi:hypothetical protein